MGAALNVIFYSELKTLQRTANMEGSDADTNSNDKNFVNSFEFNSKDTDNFDFFNPILVSGCSDLKMKSKLRKEFISFARQELWIRPLQKMFNSIRERYFRDLSFSDDRLKELFERASSPTKHEKKRLLNSQSVIHSFFQWGGTIDLTVSCLWRLYNVYNADPQKYGEGPNTDADSTADCLELESIVDDGGSFLIAPLDANGAVPVAPEPERPSGLISAVRIVLSTISDEDLDGVLRTGEWLQQTKASLDHCSHCLTVARVTLDSDELPLVFVNQAFEALTGLERTLAMGSHRKQLPVSQPQDSERQQVKSEVLTCAMSEAEGARVRVYHDPDADPSGLQILFLSPLYSDSGAFRSMVAVRSDASVGRPDGEDLVAIDDLRLLMRCLL